MQSAIAEWTPGLERNTINAAFWCLEANVYFRRSGLHTHATEMHLEHTDRNNGLSPIPALLSGFRVAPARKHLAASLAPAVLPLTLSASAISLYNHIIVFRAVVLPLGAGEAGIGRFRHDSPRINLLIRERGALSS
jgi:hypothetical protein